MSSDSLMFSSESTSPPSIRSSPLALSSSMLDCSSGSGIGSGNQSVRASPEMFRSPLFANSLASTGPLLPTHHTMTASASDAGTHDDDHVATNRPPSPSSILGTTAATWIQGLFHRSSMPAGSMTSAGGGTAPRSLSAAVFSDSHDRVNHDHDSMGGNGTESRSSFNDSTGLSSSQPSSSTLSHSMSQSMMYPLSRLRGGGAFSFSGKSPNGGSVTNDYHVGDLARESSYGGSDSSSAVGLSVDRVGGYGGGSVSMNDLYNLSLSHSNNSSRGEKRLIREGLGRGFGPGSFRGKSSQQHTAPPKYESLKDAIKSSFKSDKAVMKAALEARERKRQAKDRSHAAAAWTTATMSPTLVEKDRDVDNSGVYVAKEDSVSAGIDKGAAYKDKEKSSGGGATRALASLHPHRGSRSSSSESGGVSSSSASGGEPPASGAVVHRSSSNQPPEGLTDGSASPTTTTTTTNNNNNSPNPEGHRRVGVGASKGIAESSESELVPTKLAPTPAPEATSSAPDDDGNRLSGGMAHIIINENNPYPLNPNRHSPTTNTFPPLVHPATDGGSGGTLMVNSGAVAPLSTGRRRDHHQPHPHTLPSHRSARESMSFKSSSLLPNYSSSGATSSFSSALSTTHPVSDSSHLNDHNDYSNSSDSEDDDSISDDWDDHNPYSTHEFDADPMVGAAASGSLLGIGHHQNGPAPMSMWSSMTTLLSIPVYRSLLAGTM